MEDSTKLEPGIRLKLSHLHGGEVVYQPGRSLKPRMLSDFELVYIIEGSADYLCDDIRYHVPAGGFILGQPGFFETYRWDKKQRTRHTFFHFGIDQYPADWPAPQNWPHAHKELPQFCSGLFRHILQHIYGHEDWPYVQPGPNECRLVEALLDTFIEKQHPENASFERDRPEPVRRALLFIRKAVEENPLDPLTLGEVAKYANVTEKHLCRLFTKTVGFSPMQTFRLLKLQSAQALLTRTNLTIKEIAERCGFEDQLYFSRRFSKAFGCSPSVFRDQLKNGTMNPIKKLLPLDLIPRGSW